MENNFLKKTTTLIFIILNVGGLLSFINCNHQVSSDSQGIKASPSTFINIDSIPLNGGNFLSYQFINDSIYYLKWGNKNQSIISTESFEIKGDGRLEIDAYDNNSILLKQSCGSLCQMAVILTIPTLKLKKYLFIIAYDLKNNLVAYLSENENLFITIENFVTDKTQIINESELCPATFKVECIDSVSFENKQLYIKWQGDNWSRKQKDTRERTYNINL